MGTLPTVPSPPLMPNPSRERPPTEDPAAPPAVDAGSSCPARRRRRIQSLRLPPTPPPPLPPDLEEGRAWPPLPPPLASRRPWERERRVREKGRRQREESERGRRRERKEIETYLLVTLSWWARRSAHPIAVSARFMWVTDTYNILKESFF